MTVGEKLKQARKRASLTQKQLAEKLGVTYVNVSQWESGRRKPKLETLQRIAEILGVSYAYLIDWENSFGESDLGLIAIDIAKWIDADPNDILETMENMTLPDTFDTETVAKILAEYFRRTLLNFSEEKDESPRQHLHLHATRALIRLGADRDAAMKLISSFCSLNAIGQRKAAENTEDLAKIPEYQKKDLEE